MANDDIKYKVGMEPDLPSAEATGEKLGESVQKGIAKKTGSKNGYIKLTAEITGYKYPKQRRRPDGIVEGYDYSELQKAQDKLISSWKKLSKKGFLSMEDDVVDAVKNYRAYQRAANNQYYTRPNMRKLDIQLITIEESIGKQIENYFDHVLGSVDIGLRKTRSFYRNRY